MNGASLTESVAVLLGTEGSKVRIEREDVRAYSKWAVVSVTADQGAPRRYFVKQSRGNLRRQHELLTKANGAIRLPFFHALTSRYDPDNNLMVIDLFEGATLKDILLSGPLFGSAKFRQHLCTLFERTGAWLKAFHQIDPKMDDGRPALQAYLDRRLPELGGHVASALLAPLAGRAYLANIPTSLSHGDFSPQNILFDKEGRITVIDYGISEWEHMSPLWDIRTFTIAVERLLHESRLRELRRSGLQVEMLEAAFLRGYGQSGLESAEENIVATMRHVSFLCGHVASKTTNSRVARWHRRELVRLLPEVPAAAADGDIKR